MCSPATCRTCSKATWSGCGAHVHQVMRHVPQSERCTCNAGDRDPRGNGLFARLLGR